MPHDVGALRKLLGEFHAESKATASAVVSRSGVPLAWILPEEAHVDNFGTMTATLLGALEVIYGGLHKSAPERIVVQSADDYIVAQNITEGAFFVAIVDALTPKVNEAIGRAAKRAKSFLGTEG